LAPVNSGPAGFTVAVTPGAVGTSRWSPPELMSSVIDGTVRPVMESKPADVFSFAMLVVEVFTGAPPFEGRTPAKAAYDIFRGDRPEMPGNAQAVGLTAEMWELLEKCWHQNPENRPTMGEVVRIWRTFVGDGDDGSVVSECVQVTPVVQTLSLVTCSASYDRPRDPLPGVGLGPGTSQSQLQSPAPRPSESVSPGEHRF